MKIKLVLLSASLKKIIAAVMAFIMFIPGLFSEYFYLLSDESYDFSSAPSYVRSEYDVAAA